MKGMMNLVVIVSLLAIPLTCECKTVAYSPSIPGQPLIFHHTTPFSFEKKIASKLPSRNRYQLLHLSKLSNRLSKGLLALIGDTCRPPDPVQKVNTLINQVYQTFLKLEGSSSKQLASLVEQTLINLAHITNEMVVNREGFQQAYSEMQQQVINFYTAGLNNIVTKRTRGSNLNAISISALEGLVSCIALSILDRDSLVNHANPDLKNLILVRKQTKKMLTMFIESTFALQAITQQK